MTIGFKYWNDGDTVPASWTSIDALEFYARPLDKQYDEQDYIDGSNEAWTRRYYIVTIVFSPLQMSNSTIRSAVDTMLAKRHFRFKDTRFSYLGDANTVTFRRVGDAAPTRQAPSLATEALTLEFRSESKV